MIKLWKYRSLTALLVLAFLLLLVMLLIAEWSATRQKMMSITTKMTTPDDHQITNLLLHPPAPSTSTILRDHREDIDDGDKTKKSSSSRCNLFMGRWVYDNTSEPEYKDTSCSFIDDGMACEKFGRKNLRYKYWRWQPHDCDLPRFNSLAFLEKLRNKRLVYVGDSLNRNQWVSMVCMLESFIPQSLKSVHVNGSLVTFKAFEYNASIDFYWAPLLVESNCDNPTIHRVPERIVQVNAIENHAKHWANADVMVFNSYIWWRWPHFKIFSDGVYQQVEMLASYKMALKTWSDWLEVHVNRSNTRVFFVSSSPTHNRAEEWGAGANVNCYNETEPISNQGFWGIDSDREMMRLVEEVIDELSEKYVKVQMLNITQLSDYRKDAHSSIYRKQWDPITPDQLANPSSYADCTHWCLPGVPDVWNQFLYTYLLHF